MNSIIDYQHAIQKFMQTFTFFENQTITPGKLSDGIYFATILNTVYGFNILESQLNYKNKSWTTKLTNLKKIMQKIEKYFQEELNKGVITYNIDLVKIAKDINSQEIVNLFEVILSVLMQAPNKSDYIQAIMTLDEKSQAAFVQMIKNSMDKRVCSKQQSKQYQMMGIIQQLEVQNLTLKQQIEYLTQTNQSLKKQLTNYQQRVQQIQNQLDRSRTNKQQNNIQDLQINNKKYQKVIQNLKIKLINTIRDHQIDVATLKQEIIRLEQQSNHNKQMQEVAQIYKQRYQQALVSMNKVNVWQKQKIRLNKIIQQKDMNIYKLQQKIQQLTQKNIILEQDAIYMKLDIEKKQIKLRQIQKQFKNRVNSNTQNTSLYLSLAQKQNIIKQPQQQIQPSLKSINQKKDIQIRQYQRQNQKLSRKLEKCKLIESQKRKLESIIVEMKQQKNQELQILISTIYQIYHQQNKLFKMWSFKGQK